MCIKHCKNVLSKGASLDCTKIVMRKNNCDKTSEVKKTQCDLMHTTDEILLKELILGSESAFEKIYKKYFTHLRNYAASIVLDTEVANDIVQNIFVISINILIHQINIAKEFGGFHLIPLL